MPPFNLTPDQLHKTFELVAAEFERAGLTTSWYTIPSSIGYERLTHELLEKIYCLEVQLGASEVDGYITYAVAQLFSASYPTMVVTFLVERRVSDRMLASHLPIFTARNDKVFSGIFLPIIYKAFNHLDPSGGQRGVLVQLYHGKMSLSDLLQGLVYTIKLILRFKKEGQLAIVAVDFNDPFIRWIARVSDAIFAFMSSNVHQIPSTAELSSVEIPILDGSGNYKTLRFSTALDQGIALAASYLDKHYQSQGFTL
jgi:hypothetical protein